MAEQATTQDRIVREAVGLFKDPKEMQETIDELEMSGFPRYEISVLEEDGVSEKKWSDEGYSSLENLEDNPNTPRKVNIAREDIGFVQGIILCAGIFFGVILAISVAAIFNLSSPVAVLVGGILGAMAGAYVAKMFTARYNSQVSQQVKKGGLLLWVTTPNKEKEIKACSILNKHHAQDVHVHEVAA